MQFQLPFIQLDTRSDCLLDECLKDKGVFIFLDHVLVFFPLINPSLNGLPPENPFAEKLLKDRDLFAVHSLALDGLFHTMKELLFERHSQICCGQGSPPSYLGNDPLVLRQFTKAGFFGFKIQAVEKLLIDFRVPISQSLVIILRSLTLLPVEGLLLGPFPCLGVFRDTGVLQSQNHEAPSHWDHRAYRANPHFGDDRGNPRHEVPSAHVFSLEAQLGLTLSHQSPRDLVKIVTSIYRCPGQLRITFALELQSGYSPLSHGIPVNLLHVLFVCLYAIELPLDHELSQDPL